MIDLALLFQRAVTAATIYVSAWLAIALLWRFVVRETWQHMVGPALARRWPSAAQNDDPTRPSYLPQGQAMTLAPPPPTVHALGLINAIYVGLLLGVFGPELVSVYTLGMGTALFLAFGWHLSGTETGAERTDLAIWFARDLLIFVASVQAIQVASQVAIAA